MEYCVQGSSWLLYITEDIFLGPDGFLGMLALMVVTGFCTSQKTYSWGRTVFLACSHLKDMCMMVVMGIALNLAS